MNIVKKILVVCLIGLLGGCAAYPTPYGPAYAFDPSRVAGAGTGALLGGAAGLALGGGRGALTGALIGGAVGGLTSPASSGGYQSQSSYYDDNTGGGYQQYYPQPQQQQYYQQQPSYYPQQQYSQSPQQQPCQVYWSGSWRDGQWVKTGQYQCQQEMNAPPPVLPAPPQ